MKIGPFTVAPCCPEANSGTLSLSDIMAAHELLKESFVEPPPPPQYFLPEKMKELLWADIERRAQEAVDRLRQQMQLERVAYLIAPRPYGEVQAVRIENLVEPA